MEKGNLSTKNEVLGKLMIAGFNMKQFAAAHGYQPDTVRKVINRYAGSQKTPRGALSREILEKLSATCAGETDLTRPASRAMHHKSLRGACL